MEETEVRKFVNYMVSNYKNFDSLKQLIDFYNLTNKNATIHNVYLAPWRICDINVQYIKFINNFSSHTETLSVYNTKTPMLKRYFNIKKING